MIPQIDRSGITVLRQSSSYRGFALLQLLVALAIISVSIVPLLNGYVSFWQQSLSSDKRSRAHMLAQWKLQEQMSIPYGDVNDTDQSDCDLASNLPEANQYNCKVVVNNVNSSSSNFDVKRIDVTVFYNSMTSEGTRSVFCTNISGSSCPDLTTYRTRRAK